MKPNNLSQVRMENIKRTTPKICANNHKYIPVKGECLVCAKSNAPETMQVSEMQDETTREYDFTKPRMFKL